MVLDIVPSEHLCMWRWTQTDGHVGANTDTYNYTALSGFWQDSISVCHTACHSDNVEHHRAPVFICHSDNFKHHRAPVSIEGWEAPVKGAIL